jgi:hypothetical protein
MSIWPGLKLQKKIYAEVVVPQTVLDELQDSDAPAEARAWFSAPPTWLQISTLTFRQDPGMERLDRGEQDAIWTCRRHSPIYKQPTFMSPRGSSRFCLRTIQVHPDSRAIQPSVPCRGVQPVQHSNFQPAWRDRLFRRERCRPTRQWRRSHQQHDSCLFAAANPTCAQAYLLGVVSGTIIGL